MKQYIGIDFGTTKSATVVLDKEHIGYYPTPDEPYPSIVAIDTFTGDVECVGPEALKKKEKLQNQCRIFCSAKMELGESKSWNIGNRTWNPENIVSEIFEGLKKEVSTEGNISFNQATVAIPVEFTPEKRKALRNALKEARIDVYNLITEPTAAVYYHYEKLKKWKKVAVLDWGGGTLDISIVDIEGGYLTEIIKTGIKLGGDDIDKKVAEWAHKRVLKQKEGEIAFEEMPGEAKDDLLMKCEGAKRNLSDSIQSPITVTSYGQFGAINLVLDRDTLISLINPEIQYVIDTLNETIKKARMSSDELGCILMVGGSSKLAGLYDQIVDNFDCEIIPPDEKADWSVAHGAALLSQKSGENIIAQDIGILLSDEDFLPLFQIGDTADFDPKTLNFGLVEDSDEARFKFVEKKGETFSREVLASDLRTVGYLAVPTFGFSDEPISLSFYVDQDLLLQVYAKSKKKGEISERYWNYNKLLFKYKLPNLYGDT